MNAKSIGYWVTTGSLAFGLLSGGGSQILRVPETVSGIESLGYPLYFIVLLGVWKVLGGIAILAPRFPRLKEWAYAGTFFEMTGAAISWAVCADGARHVLVPLAFAALAVASWALRPASRRLAETAVLGSGVPGSARPSSAVRDSALADSPRAGRLSARPV